MSKVNENDNADPGAEAAGAIFRQVGATINANHELKQQGHRRQAHGDKGDQAIK